MRPIKIFGISLIVVSIAFVAVGVFIPYSNWYRYCALVTVVAGFILLTGEFGRFSMTATARNAHRVLVGRKTKRGR
jgi:hypothetical protein